MFLWTALFSLRVAGQALQALQPPPWLPAFDAWQGSSLAYAFLLPIQIAILAGMLSTSWRAWAGTMVPRRRARRWLGVLGGLYMAGSVGRLAIGLAARAPAPWFKAWIPASFHIVLAAFVLTCAAYHAADGGAE